MRIRRKIHIFVKNVPNKRKGFKWRITDDLSMTLNSIKIALKSCKSHFEILKLKFLFLSHILIDLLIDVLRQLIILLSNVSLKTLQSYFVWNIFHKNFFEKKA